MSFLLSCATITYAKNNLRIQPIKEVNIELNDAWWSPEYNLKTESKRVELFKEEEGFTSFISLIYFPEQTKLKYKKTSVYNRNDELLSDQEAEAVIIYVDEKEYTLLVVHNSPTPATHFFKINNQFVSGEVVLIEKSSEGNNKYIIKE